MNPRILIVGAGLSGAALTRFLLKSYGRIIPSISIWESQSKVGGRMMVDEFLYKNSIHRCDLGAQYISQAVSSNDDNSDVYEYLCERGTFQLLSPNDLVSGMRPESLNGKHYLVPCGTTDIIHSLLGNVTASTNKELSQLEFDSSSNRIKATSNSGVSELFDVVVLTCTSQSVLNIFESSSSDSVTSLTPLSLPNAVADRLKNVKYSSRFAWAAYFLLPAALADDLFSKVSWRAKYIMDDDVVRYVSLENFKYSDVGAEATSVCIDSTVTASPRTSACARDRASASVSSGQSESEGEGGEVKEGDQRVISVLVHTSVPYGLAHVDLLHACRPLSANANTTTPLPPELHAQKGEVEGAILNSVTKEGVLPMLREINPVQTRLVGWEQSQVSRNYYASSRECRSDRDAANSRGVLAEHVDSDDLSEPPALILPCCTLENNSNYSNNIIGAHVTASKGSEVDGRCVQESPLIVLAGDAFTESNFDGCLRSARYAAKAIVKLTSLGNTHVTAKATAHG